MWFPLAEILQKPRKNFVLIFQETKVTNQLENIDVIPTMLCMIICFQTITNEYVLIHEADPKSRPVMITIFAHVFCTSVRALQNLAKQNNSQVRIVIATGGTEGLAEWIIDDTCLVDPRPSTNQSTSLKNGSLFLVMVSIRTYVRTYVRTKQNKPIKIKPLFKLVLWLVLGRGSLYDSSLVSGQV